MPNNNPGQQQVRYEVITQEDPNTGSIYTKMKFAIGDYYSVTK